MKTLTPLQPGGYYHIYNRGNNREDLFREERNYRYFLQLYVYHVYPIADTFAYCLMRNHFHLLVRIKTVEEYRALNGTKTGGALNRLSTSPIFSMHIPKLSTRDITAPEACLKSDLAALR